MGMKTKDEYRVRARTLLETPATFDEAVVNYDVPLDAMVSSGEAGKGAWVRVWVWIPDTLVEDKKDS